MLHAARGLHLGDATWEDGPSADHRRVTGSGVEKMVTKEELYVCRRAAESIADGHRIKKSDIGEKDLQGKIAAGVSGVPRHLQQLIK